jgi:hypothetical protein
MLFGRRNSVQKIHSCGGASSNRAFVEQMISTHNSALWIFVVKVSQRHHGWPPVRASVVLMIHGLDSKAHQVRLLDSFVTVVLFG